MLLATFGARRSTAYRKAIAVPLLAMCALPSSIRALVKSGVVDSAVGCGVEVMSRVPMGATIPKEPKVGKPVTRSYWKHHEFTSQFEGADRNAKQWDISRADADAFGKLSQDRAAQAWAEGRFDSQILAIEAPELDDDRKPLESTQIVSRDEGLRETTGFRLHRIRERDPEAAAISEQRFEARRIQRRGDDQNVADTGKHQDRQRIVNHRLVVDRQ